MQFIKVSFFKWHVKEQNLVVAVFMFKLNLFRIFCPRNCIPFCPLIVLQSGICNAICDLVLELFSEGINISFRYDGTIPFQYLETVVEIWLPKSLLLVFKSRKIFEIFNYVVFRIFLFLAFSFSYQYQFLTRFWFPICLFFSLFWKGL